MAGVSAYTVSEQNRTQSRAMSRRSIATTVLSQVAAPEQQCCGKTSRSNYTERCAKRAIAGSDCCCYHQSQSTYYSGKKLCGCQRKDGTPCPNPSKYEDGRCGVHTAYLRSGSNVTTPPPPPPQATRYGSAQRGRPAQTAVHVQVAPPPRCGSAQRVSRPVACATDGWMYQPKSTTTGRVSTVLRGGSILG